jgi:hypothetical protein
MDRRRSIPTLACLLFAGLSLLAAAIMYVATHWGPTVSSDGVVYLLSADSFARGEGLGITWGSGRFHALDGFPPLYSLIVALLEKSGLGMVAAARVVSVVSFAGLVGGVGALTMRATRSLGLGLSVSVFLMTSPLLIGQFANAGSEGPFYLAGLSGLVLALVADQTHRWRDWLLVGILLGLSFLSRYMGVAMILSTAVYVTFTGTDPLRRRLGQAATMVVIAFGMIVPWLVWTHTTSGSVGGKSAHAISDLWGASEPLRAGLIDILWGWLPLVGQTGASYRVRGILLVLVVLGMLAVVFAVVSMARRRPGRFAQAMLMVRFALLFLTFAIVYAAVHAVAFLMASPTPDVSLRILAPLDVAGVLVALAVAGSIPMLRSSRKALLLLPAAVLVVVAIPNGLESFNLVTSLERDGGGYTGRGWRSYELLAAVGELPRGTPIITNAPDAIIFLTGRPTYWIPEIMRGEPDPYGSRFGDHPDQSEEEQAFREKGGVLVIAPGIEAQLRQIYGDDAPVRLEAMTRELKVVWREGNDQAIFSYPDSGEP